VSTSQLVAHLLAELVDGPDTDTLLTACLNSQCIYDVVVSFVGAADSATRRRIAELCVIEYGHTEHELTAFASTLFATFAKYSYTPFFTVVAKDLVTTKDDTPAPVEEIAAQLLQAWMELCTLTGGEDSAADGTDDAPTHNPLVLRTIMPLLEQLRGAMDPAALQSLARQWLGELPVPLMEQSLEQHFATMDTEDALETIVALLGSCVSTADEKSCAWLTGQLTVLGMVQGAVSMSSKSIGTDDAPWTTNQQNLHQANRSGAQDGYNQTKGSGGDIHTFGRGGAHEYGEGQYGATNNSQADPISSKDPISSTDQLLSLFSLVTADEHQAQGTGGHLLRIMDHSSIDFSILALPGARAFAAELLRAGLLKGPTKRPSGLEEGEGCERNNRQHENGPMVDGPANAITDSGASVQHSSQHRRRRSSIKSYRRRKSLAEQGQMPWLTDLLDTDGGIDYAGDQTVSMETRRLAEAETGPTSTAEDDGEEEDDENGNDGAFEEGVAEQERPRLDVINGDVPNDRAHDNTFQLGQAYQQGPCDQGQPRDGYSTRRDSNSSNGSDIGSSNIGNSSSARTSSIDAKHTSDANTSASEGTDGSTSHLSNGGLFRVFGGNPASAAENAENQGAKCEVVDSQDAATAGASIQQGAIANGTGDVAMSGGVRDVPQATSTSNSSSSESSGRKAPRRGASRTSSTRRSTSNTKAKAAFSRAIITTTTAIAPKLGVQQKKKKRRTVARKMSMGIMAEVDEQGRGSGHKEQWVRRECIALFRERLELTTKAKQSNEILGSSKMLALEKQPMDEFTYEVFLRQYGLPSLAKKKFTTFLSAVKDVRNSSTLVLLFYEFICRTQTIHLLGFLLQAMVLLEKVAVDALLKVDASKEEGNSAKETVAAQWVPTAHVPSMLSQLFPNHCKTRLSDLHSKVNTRRKKTECVIFRSKTESKARGGDAAAGERRTSCSTTASGGATSDGSKRERVWAVSYNHFLEAVIGERKAVDEIEDRNLQRLFLQADRNGNGVLEYTEFELLVRIINPEISDAIVMQMFREALDLHAQGTEMAHIAMQFEQDDDADDSIDPVAFSVVAREHGLQQYLAVAKDGQVALMNSLFEYYDTEGDGSIGLADLKNLCADMGYELDDTQVSLIKSVDVLYSLDASEPPAEESTEGSMPVCKKRIVFHDFIAWWHSADRASLCK
jgi:Ca2+-binding EF-hand superfamily protein